MEMPITQDATTLSAHASLDEVDASATLVAVGGNLRASKYFIPRHMRCKIAWLGNNRKGVMYIAT